MISRLISEEGGQSAAEYALIAAALVLGLFAAATGLIRLQGGLYRNQHEALQNWRAP